MVSFYWFDYETFGTHPAWDRPCQFAGVRTDSELNVMGDPLVLYCQPPLDYLPHPSACQVTGITPQLAAEQGVVESEFITRIVTQLGYPGTCSVGYNSIRFDDEFTRHTLFRNLHDAYEHEWKDGNSRWDLIDVVRLTRALRPEGIQWPVNEDGSPSNRLEHLSAINSIEHGHAHDAMSDVWATIGMAKLIKKSQPRLFDYVFANRGKAKVAQMLNLRKPTPCLQVSGMIPGSRHNTAMILPLAQHPENANAIIVLDLQHDPRYLTKLDADEIARRLYKPADTADDTPRPGLRTVQINKCPVLVPLNTLRKEDVERLQIDTDQMLEHARWAQELFADDVMGTIKQAMSHQHDRETRVDVDGSLYSGSFLSQADKTRLKELRELTPDQLPVALEGHMGHFDDNRLDEIVWRFQARNYPETLTPAQQQRWLDESAQRLMEGCSPHTLTFKSYETALDSTQWNDAQKPLEKALREYGAFIENKLTT